MNHITDTEAQFLWHTASRSFLPDQADRFEFLEDDEIDADEGSLYWCDTAADALLLIEFYRSVGIKAFLLNDLAEGLGLCVHAETEL